MRYCVGSAVSPLVGPPGAHRSPQNARIKVNIQRAVSPLVDAAPPSSVTPRRNLAQLGQSVHRQRSQKMVPESVVVKQPPVQRITLKSVCDQRPLQPLVLPELTQAELQNSVSDVLLRSLMSDDVRYFPDGTTRRLEQEASSPFGGGANSPLGFPVQWPPISYRAGYNTEPVQTARGIIPSIASLKGDIPRAVAIHPQSINGRFKHSNYEDTNTNVSRDPGSPNTTPNYKVSTAGEPIFRRTSPHFGQTKHGSDRSSNIGGQSSTTSSSIPSSFNVSEKQLRNSPVAMCDVATATVPNDPRILYTKTGPRTVYTENSASPSCQHMREPSSSSIAQRTGLENTYYGMSYHNLKPVGPSHYVSRRNSPAHTSTQHFGASGYTHIPAIVSHHYAGIHRQAGVHNVNPQLRNVLNGQSCTGTYIPNGTHITQNVASNVSSPIIRQVVLRPSHGIRGASLPPASGLRTMQQTLPQQKQSSANSGIAPPHFCQQNRVIATDPKLVQMLPHHRAFDCSTYRPVQTSYISGNPNSIHPSIRNSIQHNDHIGHVVTRQAIPFNNQMKNFGCRQTVVQHPRILQKPADVITASHPIFNETRLPDVELMRSRPERLLSSFLKEVGVK